MFRKPFLVRASIFLIIGGLLASFNLIPSAVSAQSTINIPVVDGYVSASNPTTNYGTGTTLRVDASPRTVSYLRFNVAGLGGQKVNQALLKIYTNSASTQGLVAKSVSDDNWGETTLNYNNAPAMGSTLASSGAVSAGKWITLNVTSYITGSGMFSIGVTTPGSTAISLAAHESGSKAPQLVVTIDSLPIPTSTQQPTSSKTATATRTKTSVPTLTNTVPATQTKTPIPTSTTTAVPTSTQTPTAAGGTDWQPSFPIRAAFYYPWFPEAWTQQGIYPYTNYTPQLGYYSSKDQSILKQHIAMMQYGNIDAAIASWWGQGSQTDTKIPGLLSAADGTNFRWALYYENESQGDPSAAQIQADLIYIRDHYGKNPNFLRVNGKFVVFVYAAANDVCGMADRWVQANTVGAYVVLKVFPGYASCASQPDSWHQYCPAEAADQQGSMSYAISPGFWLKGNAERLARDINRWNQNVRDMAASGVQWQLVTTFSEWGEGTSVEPAAEWASPSGYGLYLDALHSNP